MTLQDLKVVGHRLDRLWGAFKKIEGNTRLVKHDGTITALQAFEEIRYPDKALVHGMMSNVLGPGIHGAGVLVAGNTRSNRLPPTYSVQVVKVDQLVVEELWPACGVREGYVPSALVNLTKAGHRAATLRNRELKALFRRAKRTSEGASRSAGRAR